MDIQLALPAAISRGGAPCRCAPAARAAARERAQ